MSISHLRWWAGVVVLFAAASVFAATPRTRSAELEYVVARWAPLLDVVEREGPAHFADSPDASKEWLDRHIAAADRPWIDALTIHLDRRSGVYLVKPTASPSHRQEFAISDRLLGEMTDGPTHVGRFATYHRAPDGGEGSRCFPDYYQLDRTFSTTGGNYWIELRAWAPVTVLDIHRANLGPGAPRNDPEGWTDLVEIMKRPAKGEKIPGAGGEWGVGGVGLIAGELPLKIGRDRLVANLAYYLEEGKDAEKRAAVAVAGTWRLLSAVAVKDGDKYDAEPIPDDVAPLLRDDIAQVAAETSDVGTLYWSAFALTAFRDKRAIDVGTRLAGTLGDFPDIDLLVAVPEGALRSLAKDPPAEDTEAAWRDWFLARARKK